MIKLVDKKIIELYCSELPEPYARVISPLDSVAIRADKENFPFKQKIPVDFEVIYKNQSYKVLFDQYRNDQEGFKYDGASIPKLVWSLIGSNADPEFLIPAFFHDIFCNNKDLIKRNRQLSSIAFRELLIACSVPAWKANLMYIVVDNYQKFCKW